MEQGIRLAGPAREIPLASKLQFLFGGFYSQFGWVWFGFSSIHFRMLVLQTGSLRDAAGWGPALLVTAFPVVGLGMMAVGLRKGLRGLRLLRDGIPATGRVVQKETTNVKINDIPVVAFTFEFKTVDGRTARCVAKTHLTQDLEGPEGEPLVYDPKDPSVAVLLDDLPGKPRISELGVARTREGAVWPLLLVPVGTFLMHLAWTLLAR